MKFFYTNSQQFQKELTEETKKYGDNLLKSCCKTWNLTELEIDCYQIGETVLSETLTKSKINTLWGVSV